METRASLSSVIMNEIALSIRLPRRKERERERERRRRNDWIWGDMPERARIGLWSGEMVHNRRCSNSEVSPFSPSASVPHPSSSGPKSWQCARDPTRARPRKRKLTKGLLDRSGPSAQHPRSRTPECTRNLAAGQPPPALDPCNWRALPVADSPSAASCRLKLLRRVPAIRLDTSLHTVRRSSTGLGRSALENAAS